MTTLATYTQISGDLARWQTLTARTPVVATATTYWNANIGKVKSADDLVANPRLFAYAMTAFGLDDMINAKALIRKVLAGGVTDASALANTLKNPRLLAFAKSFDFASRGSGVTQTASATTAVAAAYVRQTLEKTQGSDNPGVQLALYFSRNAAKITSVYDILADRSLLTVVQTALGISPSTSSQNIDVQAANLKRILNVADFSDPAKLAKFVARFAAQYDVSHFATTSATSAGFGLSSDLLASLQGLRLGG